MSIHNQDNGKPGNPAFFARFHLYCIQYPSLVGQKCAGREWTDQCKGCHATPYLLIAVEVDEVPLFQSVVFFMFACTLSMSSRGRSCFQTVSRDHPVQSAKSRSKVFSLNRLPCIQQNLLLCNCPFVGKRGRFRVLRMAFQSFLKSWLLQVLSCGKSLTDVSAWRDHATSSLRRRRSLDLEHGKLDDAQFNKSAQLLQLKKASPRRALH